LTLLDDVRLALRSLRGQPGFLAVALLTLGIAIGANIAVFSLVNATMLRPLPFGDRSDRVVSVHASHNSEAEDWADARLSYPDLQDLRASAAIEDAGGFVERNFTLQDGEAERVVGGSVTPNLFPLLGAEPALGRQFRDDEAAAPGLESVVIITHGLWQRRLGGRSDVIGQAMQINGRGLTIVGVMPQGFAFPEDAQLYLPLRWDNVPRTQRSVATFGLLKTGQTIDQAQQAIEALASRLARTYPATHDGWSMRVLTFRDLMVDAGGRQLRTMLMTAVGFVLLIGCANLAALLLARGEARRREFAVRAALGARRLDLLRTSLVESGLIAALGTGAGLLVAAWALELLPRAFADGLPYWVDLRPDARVVSFTVALAALTAVALGAGPGLRFSRPDVNDALKSSSTGSTASPGVQRIRGLLVVAQVALSVALVTAAVILVRSLIALQDAKSGVAESELVTFRTYLSGDQYDAVEARAAAFKAIVDELQSTPGVRSVAATTSIPTDDGGTPIQLAPGATWVRGRELGAQRVAVSPALFSTLGLDVDGRTFTGDEYSNALADVVIVSRALADRLWPGESALDRRLSVVTAGRLEAHRVVGVAPDIVYEEIGEETEQSRLIVYVPYARVASRTMAVMVRTAGTPDASMATIRGVMRQRFAGVPAYDLRTMAQVRTYTTWEQRIFGEVMAGFAVVAMALAWLGVYGLVAYAVARRTREIGVRMALGAQRYDVVRMVMADVGAMAVAGVGLGLLLGAALARFLEGSVYGVDARDPRLLLTAAVTMATAMFAAALWPARRAMQIQPVVALRCD
jgi:putative ABC transport system permease protein